MFGFGIIPDFISAITTILLPAYLSYKSLRTHDPAQTHPWLIYFTILSLTFLFEQWTYFILGWVPFYAWFRLMFLLYLVLPQTQGAKVLYLDYLEPFIVEHETNIDRFIGDAHARLQQFGLGYVNLLIEFVRERLLGQKSIQPPPGQRAGAQGVGGYGGGYAQDLLSRFAMPSARSGAPGTSAAGSGPGGVFGMVSGLAATYAASQAGGGAGAGRTRDMGGAGVGGSAALYEAAQIPDSLVSDNLSGGSSAEKANFISMQRERLGNLMRALDMEQQNLDLAYGSGGGGRPSSSGSGFGSGGGLKTKSKSEQSFEKVDYEDTRSSGYGSPSTGSRSTSGATGGGGSWVPAGLGGLFGGGGPSQGQQGQGGDNSTGTSKGWNAARDITEAMTSAYNDAGGARKR